MSFKIVPTVAFERELKQLLKKHIPIRRDLVQLGVQMQADPTMGTSIEIIALKYAWQYLPKEKVNPVAQG